jgi:hypothetical protein
VQKITDANHRNNSDNGSSRHTFWLEIGRDFSAFFLHSKQKLFSRSREGRMVVCKRGTGQIKRMP